MTKKTRDREKKFLIEGFNLVDEALRIFGSSRQFRPEFALVSEKAARSGEGRALLKTLKGLDVPVETVSEPIVKDLSQVEAPQGVFAVVGMREANLHELLYSEKPLVLACSGVQDPGNLGTMMRTARAARSSGLLLGGGTVDPYNDKVVRASMGAVFHVPVVRSDDLVGDLGKFRKAGFRAIAASQDARTSMWSADLAGPTVLVLGGEGGGLPRSIAGACDASVSIPMPGGAESLNVAVAASVLVYEVLRQRQTVMRDAR